MARGSYQAINAAVLSFLVKAPRTVPELLHLLGVPADLWHSRASALRRWLRALEAEGLITKGDPKKNPRGRSTPSWKWNA